MKRKKEPTKDDPAIPVIRHSFIAANGYSGFRSHYADIFNSRAYDRVFVIKGGPGTGKSHTMRIIGKAGEDIGAYCEYIYCSSDPSSLDGVILEKSGRRIALLDGTAPHTRCADIPGVIDEILNLGDFWDSQLLERDKILPLTEKKGDCYRRAYRYLSIAGKADALLYEEVSKCILHEKMEKAIERELRRLSPSAKETKREVRYLSACSMQGEAHLPAPADVEKIISVSDVFGSAAFYLSTFEKMLRSSSPGHYVVYPSCYCESKIEGVYLPENKVLFLINAANAERQINMKRFLSPAPLAARRTDIKTALKTRDGMCDCAVLALREASQYHFALEALYGKAMDFTRKEIFTQRLTERILSYLSEGC